MVLLPQPLAVDVPEKLHRPKLHRKSAAIRYNLFAHEYVKDLNGTRAAVAAGYSPNNAGITASKLLCVSKVQQIIASLVAKKAEKIDLSSDRILKEIGRCAYSNMEDYTRLDERGDLVVDLSKLTREQAAAIQDFTVDTTGGRGDGVRKLVWRTRIKLADKIRALELLGKYRRLFIEQVEVSGLEGLADLLRARRKAIR